MSSTLPTRLRNLLDGTLIDLILTNRSRSFLKSQNFEIGLSDCHKLVVSILRASFKKRPRKIINTGIKNDLARTIFVEIWTADYYKGSSTEIAMNLT